MKLEDLKPFRAIMRKLFIAYGRSVDQETMDVWWDLMQGIELEAFAEAAVAYMATETHWPTPAAIRKMILRKDGHYSPEAAWAWCPKSESETKFVTREMLQSWDVAREDYESGNKVGARIAFVAEYTTAVDQARLLGNRAVWFLSRGCGMRYDDARNAEIAAISHAASAGLLPAPIAQQLIGEQRMMLGCDDTDVLKLASSAVKRIKHDEQDGNKRN